MDLGRSGSQPSARGPEDGFTGTARPGMPFKGEGDARVSGAAVAFAPGARTAWHMQPLGQTPLVVSGLGRAARAGGPVEETRPGDVVWFAPGEKHWHDAAPKRRTVPWPTSPSRRRGTGRWSTGLVKVTDADDNA